MESEGCRYCGTPRFSHTNQSKYDPEEYVPTIQQGKGVCQHHLKFGIITVRARKIHSVGHCPTLLLFLISITFT